MIILFVIRELAIILTDNVPRNMKTFDEYLLLININPFTIFILNTFDFLLKHGKFSVWVNP